MKAIINPTHEKNNEQMISRNKYYSNMKTNHRHLIQGRNPTLQNSETKWSEVRFWPFLATCFFLRRGWPWVAEFIDLIQYSRFPTLQNGVIA